MEENEPTISERVAWLRAIASAASASGGATTPAEIEVLLHLRSQPGKAFKVGVVATALRLPVAAAEQHLAALCGRGFLSVTLGSDLAYAYQPVKAVDDVLDAIAIALTKKSSGSK